MGKKKSKRSDKHGKMQDKDPDQEVEEAVAEDAQNRAQELGKRLQRAKDKVEKTNAVCTQMAKEACAKIEALKNKQYKFQLQMEKDRKTEYSRWVQKIREAEKRPEGMDVNLLWCFIADLFGRVTRLHEDTLEATSTSKVVMELADVKETLSFETTLLQQLQVSELFEDLHGLIELWSQQVDVMSERLEEMQSILQLGQNMTIEQSRAAWAGVYDTVANMKEVQRTAFEYIASQSLANRGANAATSASTSGHGGSTPSQCRQSRSKTTRHESFSDVTESRGVSGIIHGGSSQLPTTPRRGRPMDRESYDCHGILSGKRGQTPEVRARSASLVEQRERGASSDILIWEAQQLAYVAAQTDNQVPKDMLRVIHQSGNMFEPEDHSTILGTSDATTQFQRECDAGGGAVAVHMQPMIMGAGSSGSLLCRTPASIRPFISNDDGLGTQCSYHESSAVRFQRQSDGFDNHSGMMTTMDNESSMQFMQPSSSIPASVTVPMFPLQSVSPCLASSSSLSSGTASMYESPLPAYLRGV